MTASVIAADPIISALEREVREVEDRYYTYSALAAAPHTYCGCGHLVGGHWLAPRADVARVMSVTCAMCDCHEIRLSEEGKRLVVAHEVEQALRYGTLNGSWSEA